MNINLFDKALAIFNKEASQNLTFESLKEKLKQIFESNKHLSKSQIKVQMLEYIKTKKIFGGKAAQAASYLELNNIPEHISKQRIAEYALKNSDLSLQEDMSVTSSKSHQTYSKTQKK